MGTAHWKSINPTIRDQRKKHLFMLFCYDHFFYPCQANTISFPRQGVILGESKETSFSPVKSEKVPHDIYIPRFSSLKRKYLRW